MYVNRNCCVSSWFGFQGDGGALPEGMPIARWRVARWVSSIKTHGLGPRSLAAVEIWDLGALVAIRSSWALIYWLHPFRFGKSGNDEVDTSITWDAWIVLEPPWSQVMVRKSRSFYTRSWTIRQVDLMDLCVAICTLWYSNMAGNGKSLEEWRCS